MDFEQLRKDMEDSIPLTEALRQKAAASLNGIGDPWGDWVCQAAAEEMEQTRRIALAAEKYRKADDEVKVAQLGSPLIRALGLRADARAELFALLTSKDAT